MLRRLCKRRFDGHERGVGLDGAGLHDLRLMCMNLHGF